MEQYARFEHGDLVLRYFLHNERMGMQLIPAKLENKCVEKQCPIEPLVQLKFVGDAYSGGFSQGLTLSGSKTTEAFSFQEQSSKIYGETLEVTTLLKDKRGYLLEHSVQIKHHVATIKVAFTNQTQTAVELEYITSCAMGGLTPFVQLDPPGSLELIRMRSFWSAEGRLSRESLDLLQMEPSWSKFGARGVRFGQVGSMPVREYFPFAAIEDKEAGCIWAMQLEASASWQIEIFRSGEGISMRGGLGDREMAHWIKPVLPGERFETPKAFLTAVEGDVDDACYHLVHFDDDYLDTLPQSEHTLPIIFNEWCTSWGTPSMENIKKMVDVVSKHDIAYFVIDAGWYKSDEGVWHKMQGDWIPNKTFFPNGIKEAADYIRSRGMIPGIWFEFEVAGSDAQAYHETDHMLRRDGYPITVGARRFWDMEDPWVEEYLDQRFLGLLKDNGFGYLKVDYNDTIGVGCDGARSQGEALRRKIEATKRYFQKLRDTIPELVIENCSSGGHRLEPGMTHLTSMSSITDAHECIEIPIIAANVQRAIKPAQSQIWAVLHASDSLQRVYYILISTLLGRMCLSGEIIDLNEAQWQAVDRTIAFYHKVSPIIKKGLSKRFGTEICRYGQPEGYQAVVRYGQEGALVVVHAFANCPEKITVPLEFVAGESEILEEGESVFVGENEICIQRPKEFSAAAVYVRRK